MAVKQLTGNPFEELLVKPGTHMLKCIVFGSFGTGKTRFLGTAGQDSRTSPILILDFEGGSLSLEGVGEGVDVIRVTSTAILNDVFNLLSGDHPYKSIGFDSLTETHIAALFNILDSDRRKEPNLIQLQDYGIASVITRRLVRALRDLPMHVFLTALEKQEIDSIRGQVTRVDLSGKLAVEIPALVDVVGYLSSSEPEGEDVAKRVLVLQNYLKIDAKVRTPIGVEAPDEIWEPTVTKLLDALHL